MRSERPKEEAKMLLLLEVTNYCKGLPGTLLVTVETNQGAGMRWLATTTVTAVEA